MDAFARFRVFLFRLRFIEVGCLRFAKSKFIQITRNQNWAMNKKEQKCRINAYRQEKKPATRDRKTHIIWIHCNHSYKNVHTYFKRWGISVLNRINSDILQFIFIVRNIVACALLNGKWCERQGHKERKPACSFLFSGGSRTQFYLFISFDRDVFFGCCLWILFFVRFVHFFFWYMDLLFIWQ